MAEEATPIRWDISEDWRNDRIWLTPVYDIEAFSQAARNICLSDGSYVVTLVN